MSAGPTAIDMFANMALAIGLAHSLAGQAPAPESQLPFAAAKSNFYEAARYGLAAQVTWQGRPWVLKELLLEQWLPLAFHAFALYRIYTGFTALNHFQKAEQASFIKGRA